MVMGISRLADNTRSTGAEVAGMAKKRFSGSLLHLSHIATYYMHVIGCN